MNFITINILYFTFLLFNNFSFRDTFFAFGGSCPSGEIFRRFKGRDPNPEAFISDLGLDKDDSN